MAKKKIGTDADIEGVNKRYAPYKIERQEVGPFGSGYRVSGPNVDCTLAGGPDNGWRSAVAKIIEAFWIYRAAYNAGVSDAVAAAEPAIIYAITDYNMANANATKAKRRMVRALRDLGKLQK